MVAVLEPGTTVAGVFTRSLDAGRAGRLVPRALTRGKARAIVVNSGNANVFTGRAGREAVRGAPPRPLAKLVGCDAARRSSSPRPASSASRCRPRRSSPALPATARERARRRPGATPRAAIMTTDTFPKAPRARADDRRRRRSRINGIAKGSGMIAPDMATMLAFVFTDAAHPGAGAAGAADARRTSARSTASPSTATPRPATRCCCSRPARPAHSACRAPAIRCSRIFRRALDEVHDRPGAAGRARRRGRGEIRHHRRSRARPRHARRATHRRSPSATRRWSRPRSRRATPIGAASSWRSARPARRPTATGWRSRVGGVRIAEKGGPVPGYDEAPVARHMKGREIEIAIDLGIGTRHAPRSGPATSRTAISTSTAAIAAERGGVGDGGTRRAVDDRVRGGRRMAIGRRRAVRKGPALGRRQLLFLLRALRRAQRRA